MRVLVTGAAGFIGSNLAEKLAMRGDEVIGLDNFNDYYDPAKKRANTRRLNKYPNFRMVEDDIRNRREMFHIFTREKFDAVAHLAALAGVRHAIQNPALYVEVNFSATQHLMDAALAAGGIQNFVFASTSSVYGATKRIPFVETDPCDRPLQPYAAAKRSAEILGYTYHYLFGLNFTTLRFFTVYGPNGRPDMMAYLVADSITKGTKLLLHDNGQMFRDWTFVEDITDGILAALDTPLGYEIINLGRGELTRLSEFVSLLEGLAGMKANVEEVPRPVADIEKACADIGKAKRLLGYDPKVSVRDGVTRFWEWYLNKEL